MVYLVCVFVCMCVFVCACVSNVIVLFGLRLGVICVGGGNRGFQVQDALSRPTQKERRP